VEFNICFSITATLLAKAHLQLGDHVDILWDSVEKKGRISGDSNGRWTIHKMGSSKNRLYRIRLPLLPSFRWFRSIEKMTELIAEPLDGAIDFIFP
jgi:hypothetical protein